uniref:Uncharacterized protein n=1 Tax=Timema tahoe TaxID=61484 RepID=A0A7R9FL37_9NEOP|nr:unnamed protein product [Timema tahoe]
MALKKITVPLYRDYEVTSASRQFCIRGGYRPECSSFCQCVASLFQSTNETANFWTSFLPGLYFTYLLMTSYRTDSSHLWPYYGYLLTVTTVLLLLERTPAISGRTMNGLQPSLAVLWLPADCTLVIRTDSSHLLPYYGYLLTVLLTDSSHLWPYYGYLLTVTTCHWVSSCAHAFCNISLRARNILFFFDYSAISLYSFGSAILYISYSFPHRLYSTSSISMILHLTEAPFQSPNFLSMLPSAPRRYEQMYLPVAAVLSVGSTTLACTSRVLAPVWSQKYLILVSYGLTYVWDHLPILARVSSEGLSDDPAARLYLGHFLALGFAIFFYGTHIPERLAPGKFDYLGELQSGPLNIDL